MNNFFQFSDKKATCLKWTEIKVSQIPRNRELNWIFLSVSSKRTIFLKTLRQQSFFFISFCSFKGVQYLFGRTLHLFFQVTLCNQPIVVLRHLKRYGTGTVKPYSTSPWTIGFSTVTYIKRWWSVKDLQKNALKI